MKIDHIGIAVKDSKVAIEKYKKIYPNLEIKTEISKNEDMKISFLKFDNIEIEILEPLKEESVIHKFIQKHGEGIHHISLQVDNIQEKINHLQDEKIKLINNNPQPGSHDSLITFLHPKDFNGVLIELCQK